MEAQLFNCCTDGILPDMKDFKNLEINAVYIHQTVDNETYCETLFGIASGNVPLDKDKDESKLV